MSIAPSAGACLSEDDVASYLAGNGQPAEVVTRHIAGCGRCRRLLGEAARSVDAPTAATPVATLRPGEVVDERYEVIRFIARGGMGEVYEARDRVLGAVVALKTLTCAILESEVAVARLKQEVLIARRITHQNVCRLFDFSVHQQPGPRGPVQIPFLTMELLRGQTLGERVRLKGPFSVPEARPLLQQMIAGLEAVHAAGIIHRDFKSDNVFLVTQPGGGERAVIMDLGLARREDPAPSGVALTGDAVVGTLDYMAPEQLEGQAPRPGFDIYALGVVIFEMITGRRPFTARTPIATALKRFREEPPVPSSALAGVDPALDPLVSRCLEKDPSRRFASMAEVRQALEQPRSAPGGRSRRRLIAAVIGVVAATAIGAPVLFMRSQRLEAKPVAPVVEPSPMADRRGPPSGAGDPSPLAAPLSQPAAPVERPTVAPVEPSAVAPPSRNRRVSVRPAAVKKVEPAPAPVPPPSRPESTRKKLLMEF